VITVLVHNMSIINVSLKQTVYNSAVVHCLLTGKGLYIAFSSPQEMHVSDKLIGD